jgi:hypothetical protein
MACPRWQRARHVSMWCCEKDKARQSHRARCVQLSLVHVPIPMPSPGGKYFCSTWLYFFGRWRGRCHLDALESSEVSSQINRYFTNFFSELLWSCCIGKSNTKLNFPWSMLLLLKPGRDSNILINQWEKKNWCERDNLHDGGIIILFGLGFVKYSYLLCLFSRPHDQIELSQLARP